MDHALLNPKEIQRRTDLTFSEVMETKGLCGTFPGSFSGHDVATLLTDVKYSVQDRL